MTSTRPARPAPLTAGARAELELTRRSLIARIDRLHRSTENAYRVLAALNEVLGPEERAGARG